MGEPFAAFPSGFVRIEGNRCGRATTSSEAHANQRKRGLPIRGQAEGEVTTKLVVSCVFSGVFVPGVPPIDPERAVTELQQAGYEVSRPPDTDVDSPGHPLGDYFEATIEGPDDPKIIEAVRQEVEAIVAKYGGEINEWGVL